MDSRIARVAEDNASTLLGPDTLVPAQYFDRLGSDAAFQAEKRLMLAVLEGEVSVVQAAMALGISSSRASDTLQAIMWNAARRGIITVKKA